MLTVLYCLILSFVEFRILNFTRREKYLTFFTVCFVPFRIFENIIILETKIIGKCILTMQLIVIPDTCLV